jgi:integrase
MKQLLFGCSYSELWVSPSKDQSGKGIDWATTTAKSALSKNWYVQCNFYDPEFKDQYPDGFPYRKKCNRAKDLSGRRALVRFYLSEIPKLFEELGYNPITGAYMIQQPVPDPSPEEPIPAGLDKRLPVPEALDLARRKITGGDEYKNEVRIAVNRFCKSLKALRKDQIPIKDITFAHLNDAIDQMGLTDDYANKCRQYFIAVFKVLKKYQCCTSNLAKDLEIRKVLRKKREVLTIEQWGMIWDYFKRANYSFYRYSRIFFFSGTRSTELFSVQAKHVRIDRQEYDVVVKKGKQYAWETKVIMQDVQELWCELISECRDPEDYLFSSGRKPGPEPGNPKQISKRWRQHVKTKLAFHEGKLCELSALSEIGAAGYEAISADFYSGKHTFLDLLDQRQSTNNLDNSEVYTLISGLDVDQATKTLLLARLAPVPDFDLAQKMAAHRSVGLTNKVYKINKGRRENEFLKGLRIEKTAPHF